MSILLKMSLICISIPVVSGCLPVTLFTGAAGIGDSMYKSHQIGAIEKRIAYLEYLLEKKYKPYQYIPSYVDMETFKKGIYDR